VDLFESKNPALEGGAADFFSEIGGAAVTPLCFAVVNPMNPVGSFWIT
jgi:hypothetical protein